MRSGTTATQSHHKHFKSLSLLARLHTKYDHTCHTLNIATCVSLCHYKVKIMNNYNQTQAGYSAPDARDDVPTKGHAGRNLKRELTALTLITNQLTDAKFLFLSQVLCSLWLQIRVFSLTRIRSFISPASITQLYFLFLKGSWPVP